MKTIKFMWVCLFIVCLFPCHRAYGKEASREVLKVTIQPGKKSNTVNCRIQNVTRKKQEFWFWSCSYWQNWKIEGKGISGAVWGCDRNVLAIDFLQPGQSREWELPIRISTETINDQGVFRMAFVPSQPSSDRVAFYSISEAVKKNPDRRSSSPLKGVFWSNKLKINDVR